MGNSYFLVLMLAVLAFRLDAQSNFTQVEYEVPYHAVVDNYEAETIEGHLWFDSVLEMLRNGEIQAYHSSSMEDYSIIAPAELKFLLNRVDTVYMVSTDAEDKLEMKIFEFNFESKEIESIKFREKWSWLPSGKLEKQIEAMAPTVALLNSAGEKVGQNKEVFWIKF